MEFAILYLIIGGVLGVLGIIIFMPFNCSSSATHLERLGLFLLSVFLWPIIIVWLIVTGRQHRY
jgi:hypothetical protein